MKRVLTEDRLRGFTKIYITRDLNVQMGSRDVTEKEVSLCRTHGWRGPLAEESISCYVLVAECCAHQKWREQEEVNKQFDHIFFFCWTALFGKPTFSMKRSFERGIIFW